jgi:hypothetical protein
MVDPKKLKTALDALNIALNDPVSATTDPRTDDDYEHPWGSKGTEPEDVKYGARKVDPSREKAEEQYKKILAHLEKHGWWTAGGASNTRAVYHPINLTVKSPPHKLDGLQITAGLFKGEEGFRVYWHLNRNNENQAYTAPLKQGDTYAGLVAALSELGEDTSDTKQAAGDWDSVELLKAKAATYLLKQGWHKDGQPGDLWINPNIPGHEIIVYTSHVSENGKTIYEIGWDLYGNDDELIEEGDTYAGLVAILSELSEGKFKRAKKAAPEEDAPLTDREKQQIRAQLQFQKIKDLLFKRGFKRDSGGTEDGVFVRDAYEVNAHIDRSSYERGPVIGWSLYRVSRLAAERISRGDSYAGLVIALSELSEGKHKQAAAIEDFGKAKADHQAERMIAYLKKHKFRDAYDYPNSYSRGIFLVYVVSSYNRTEEGQPKYFAKWELSYLWFDENSDEEESIIRISGGETLATMVLALQKVDDSGNPVPVQASDKVAGTEGAPELDARQFTALRDKMITFLEKKGFKRSALSANTYRLGGGDQQIIDGLDFGYPASYEVSLRRLWGRTPEIFHMEWAVDQFHREDGEWKVMGIGNTYSELVICVNGLIDSLQKQASTKDIAEKQIDKMATYLIKQGWTGGNKPGYYFSPQGMAVRDGLRYCFHLHSQYDSDHDSDNWEARWHLLRQYSHVAWDDMERDNGFSSLVLKVQALLEPESKQASSEEDMEARAAAQVLKMARYLKRKGFKPRHQREHVTLLRKKGKGPGCFYWSSDGNIIVRIKFSPYIDGITDEQMYDASWSTYDAHTSQQTGGDEGLSTLVIKVVELLEGNTEPKLSSIDKSPAVKAQEDYDKIRAYLNKRGWGQGLTTYENPKFPGYAIGVTYFQGIRTTWAIYQRNPEWKPNEQAWIEIKKDESYASLVAALSEIEEEGGNTTSKQASADQPEEVFEKIKLFLMKKRFSIVEGFTPMQPDWGLLAPEIPGQYPALASVELAYTDDVFEAAIYLSGTLPGVDSVHDRFRGKPAVHAENYSEFILKFLHINETYANLHRPKQSSGTSDFDRAVQFLKKRGFNFNYKSINPDSESYNPGSWAELRPSNKDSYLLDVGIVETRDYGFGATIFLNPHTIRSVEGLPTEPDGALRIECGSYGEFLTNLLKIQEMEEEMNNKNPLLNRPTAGVDIHETPKILPQRDDMRTHLDEDIKKELHDEGKIGRLKAALRKKRAMSTEEAGKLKERMEATAAKYGFSSAGADGTLRLQKDSVTYALVIEIDPVFFTSPSEAEVNWRLNYWSTGSVRTRSKGTAYSELVLALRDLDREGKIGKLKAAIRHYSDAGGEIRSIESFLSSQGFTEESDSFGNCWAKQYVSVTLLSTQSEFTKNRPMVDRVKNFVREKTQGSVYWIISRNGKRYDSGDGERSLRHALKAMPDDVLGKNTTSGSL